MQMDGIRRRLACYFKCTGVALPRARARWFVSKPPIGFKKTNKKNTHTHTQPLLTPSLSPGKHFVRSLVDNALDYNETENVHPVCFSKEGKTLVHKPQQTTNYVREPFINIKNITFTYYKILCLSVAAAKKNKTPPTFLTSNKSKTRQSLQTPPPSQPSTSKN